MTARLDREAAAAELRRYLDTDAAHGALSFELSRGHRAESGGRRSGNARRSWWSSRGRIRICCSSTTGSCSRRSSTSRCAGCGSIPSFTIGCASTAAIFALRGWPNCGFRRKWPRSGCAQTHEPFRFNPMGARERRIIHLALKDQPGVRTSSEGQGEMRQVVIFPADAKGDAK